MSSASRTVSSASVTVWPEAAPAVSSVNISVLRQILVPSGDTVNGVNTHVGVVFEMVICELAAKPENKSDVASMELRPPFVASRSSSGETPNSWRRR